MTMTGMVEFEAVDDDDGVTVLPDDIIFTVVVEKSHEGSDHQARKSMQEFRVSWSHMISSDEVISLMLSEGGVPPPFHVKPEALNEIRNAVSEMPADEYRLNFYFVLFHWRNEEFFVLACESGNINEDLLLRGKECMIRDGGINFSYIKRLKTLIIAGNYNLFVCSICLEDTVEGDAVIHLPCAHGFHCDCIIKWSDRNQSCPLCRVRFYLRS